ncbi:MAG: bifunctional sugar-1-phosphate nucleotidylyltransferase/acetyltransferase [Chloroflexota bacterium]|nr:bifunctional sugar-1-phosphate nucleotidylyltransferase/acetyltransferase [Chloroflexota bacterium]
MNAVILAAGEGKRMHPLTYTRPKVMVPLVGKPILEHVLLEINRAGIDRFVFVVGYHDQAIRNYFGDGGNWGVSITYMTQRKQLGTADAVRNVGSLIEGNFLLANGDAIIRSEDIRKIVTSKTNTMGLIELENSADMGVVEVEGETIIRIHEKVEHPPSNLINAGTYLLTPEIFTAISDTPKSPRGEYELTDSLQLLIDRGIPLTYEMIGSWINLSYPWDMLVANERLLEEMEPQNLGEIESNAILKGPVSVGKGTVIRSNSYIIGPVVIGENCDIGPSCYIRASTAIGDNCHIGASVEVKNSIIMNGSKVPHHNYVGDSIIGENCNLGAGTKVANLKLDKGNICVGNVDTGRRKLGAMIGDGVQIGINSCLNVGCSIGNESIVGPGMVAKGIIRPRAKVF